MASKPTGNPVGRPPKYQTEDELQTLVDAYFEHEDQVAQPYTFYGLALALDLTRKQLLEYEGRDRFRNIIKKAKNRIRLSVERKVMNGQGNAGLIFWLKNNAGWADKTEIKHSGGVSVGIEGALQAAQKAAEKAAKTEDDEGDSAK